MEEENIIQTEQYKSFVGVKFASGKRSYFFGVLNDDQFEIDDAVVVETARGLELGFVSIKNIDIANYRRELGLKPIIRKADENDLRVYEINKKDAKFALEICENEVKRLGLNMNLISCEYTLDKSKVLFSYLADERVDFRELLKSLASKLHTRIDLRQIGARDKAKAVGGIGVCGLPLCCSTFLNEFDGISITRAKNQMLAINIPKLSGQCGKLLCCLKYEDDLYAEEKNKYPDLGSKLYIDNVEYTVTSVNIISTVIKVESEDDIKFVPYKDLKKIARFPKKNRNEEK